MVQQINQHSHIKKIKYIETIIIIGIYDIKYGYIKLNTLF